MACNNADVIRAGANHCILSKSGTIGWYLRIGFSVEDPTKKVKWLQRIEKAEKRFAAEVQRVRSIQLEPEDRIKLAEHFQKPECSLMAEMWGPCRTRPHVYLITHLVRAAEGNLAEEINKIFFEPDYDGISFGTKMESLIDKVGEKFQLYAEFVKNKTGASLMNKITKKIVDPWVGFSFDLQPENILLYKKEGQEKKEVFLCDLDVEDGNFITSKEKADLFWSLKSTEPKILKSAMMIVFGFNAVHALPLRKKCEFMDTEHAHFRCAEFILCHCVSNVLVALKPEEIQQLFRVMTANSFWRESMVGITHYLQISDDPKIYKKAWEETTGEEPTEDEKKLTRAEKDMLDRRRWLFLLMVNTFKCSQCEKPDKRIVRLLLPPLWGDLYLPTPPKKEGWFAHPPKRISFAFSPKFLRKWASFGVTVERDHQKQMRWG